MKPVSASPMRHHGLSLVEVVASIALLGGILVSMLTAHSRLVRQVQRSDMIRTATTLADDQLAEWFVNSQCPVSGSGVIETNPEFQWSTRVVRQVPGISTPTVIVLYQVVGKINGVSEVLFETELILEHPNP